MNKKLLLRFGLLSLLALGVACGDDDEDMNPGMIIEPAEVITTVRLSLTSGGNTVLGTWTDADGEGGAEPVIVDPMPLTAGSTYAVSIELLNELETPAEDITEEIRAEAEEHLFFYVQTGDVVSVAIDDVESQYTTNSEGEDLPVGLSAELTADVAGMGTLQVVLKHLPPINETPQKTAATTINDGESDIDVTFNITVQ